MSRDWVEHDHPRWPGGTSHGGEFREAGLPGGWLSNLAGFNAGRMSFDQVASYLGRSDYTESHLSGGQSASTVLRTYSDGRRLVHKSYPGWNHDQADGEVEASLVGRAIGTPIPAVVRDPAGEADLLMEYIPGDDPWRLFAGRYASEQHAALDTDRYLQFQQSYKDSDAGRLIGFLDVLSRGMDRHTGNWIIAPDGTPVAIDHGGAFDPEDYFWLRDPQYYQPPDSPDQDLIRGGSPFARRLFGWDDNADTSTFPYFSPADIAETRRRIQQLRGQLRPTSYEGVMSVLDLLRPTGTGRRIQ